MFVSICLIHRVRYHLAVLYRGLYETYSKDVGKKLNNLEVRESYSKESTSEIEEQFFKRRFVKLYTSKSLILVTSFLTIATNFSNNPVVLGIFYIEDFMSSVFRSCFTSCVAWKYDMYVFGSHSAKRQNLRASWQKIQNRPFSWIDKLTVQRPANVSAQNLVAEEMTNSIYHRASILYDNFNQEGRLLYTFY